MPFIRGRYHINAIAGEALEAAREAEAALLALEHEAGQAGSPENDGDDEAESADAGGAANGPIHRVEIEAAELVPPHSGRAQRGFVAHVHHEAAQADPGGRGYAQSAAGGNYARPGGAAQTGIASLRSPQAGQLPTVGNAARPETHVFADHRDLVNFLRDEFAKSCHGG